MLRLQVLILATTTPSSCSGVEWVALGKLAIRMRFSHIDECIVIGVTDNVLSLEA